MRSKHVSESDNNLNSEHFQLCKILEKLLLLFLVRQEGKTWLSSRNGLLHVPSYYGQVPFGRTF